MYLLPDHSRARLPAPSLSSITIANLADKADRGKVQIQVQADSTDGFDLSWLRNAVQEPLDEGQEKGSGIFLTRLGEALTCL